MLKPHSFSPQVSLMRPPHIYLTENAWRDQNVIVQLSKEEIGWLGLVYQTEKGDFVIDEIFMPKQEVSSHFCELDEKSIAELGQELLQRENGLEVANRLLFWGHSHAYMSTNPSDQDDRQMRLFKNNKATYAIRGILNKDGRAQFDVFFFETGMIIKDVAWSLYDPKSKEVAERWTAEIKEKITVKVIVVPNKGNGRGAVPKKSRSGSIGATSKSMVVTGSCNPVGKHLGEAKDCVPEEHLDILRAQGYDVGDLNDTDELEFTDFAT